MAMESEIQPISAAEAASALQWWSDAGVDCLVDEAPRDWLAQRAEADALPSDAGAAAQRIGSARAPEAAELPAQLNLFRAWLAESEQLPFAAPAAPRVCPSGDPTSGLMLLTDMPASEDCASGTLLSGEAGRLFDRMLAAIGRDRDSIYLASLSCLRSPSGRFSDDSAARCAAYARHHIGLAAPKAVLLLGDTCSRALIGLAVAQARGRWHQISTHAGDIPALASFSPAHLLNRPGDKKHAWVDLQMLMEKLGQ